LTRFHPTCPNEIQSEHPSAATLQLHLLGLALLRVLLSRRRPSLPADLLPGGAQLTHEYASVDEPTGIEQGRRTVVPGTAGRQTNKQRRRQRRRRHRRRRYGRRGRIPYCWDTAAQDNGDDRKPMATAAIIGSDRLLFLLMLLLCCYDDDGSVGVALALDDGRDKNAGGSALRRS
jgi:hypothetical protein